ncbi:hypothetical protein UFOVP28_25 [uncultured Caudovirales phage]|uniref:Uncharacterized protein n=1 Tax=uncultured Caudovirales phage TaxID=2100421 RepID=A0A6J5KKA0_9CAUD|nr:hypothetical protein UFOVP28_25 [uncultured Caudovirales phage]
MVSWRKPREPASGFSYKLLPPDAMDAALEACSLYRVGIRDLIDDPVPSKLEQDPNHQKARAWFVRKMSSPLIIRGKIARNSLYNNHEIALMLDRSAREISYIKGDLVKSGGEIGEEEGG